MDYRVGDLVRISDYEAFLYRAIGVIACIYDDCPVPYHVQFKAINEDTNETFVYEDFYYSEDQLQLYYREGEC